MRKMSFMVRLGLSAAAWGAIGSGSTLAFAEELSDSPPNAETKPEPSKPEPSKPEPSKPEPSKPEPSKPEPSKPEPTRAEGVERHGSAFVDPLGFALFGPRLGVEAGAGHFSGALSARWFNAGLLSHSLFAKGDDKLAFGYGLGLRARYYLPEGLDGVHLGVAAEYLHSRVENQPLLIATNSGYFVPYAEVGYRLAVGRLYADVSAGVGYALRLSSGVENLPGGASAGSYHVLDESSVYGTASLDLGVFF
jgi:hypothetical protein